MLHFLLPLLVSFSAFAGLERLSFKNVNLDYQAPHGLGTAERISIATSFTEQSFPFELKREDKAFFVTTPFIDYTWVYPPLFLYEAEALSAQKLNLSIGKKVHKISGDRLSFKPKGKRPFIAETIEGQCAGNSSGELLDRLFEDCHQKMNLTVKKLDLPQDFILNKIARVLTEVGSLKEMPADHLILKVEEGKYALQIYLTYWFYAGLRSWGTISYENDYKTMVINVDQIKFGYLSVTSVVMNKLKELNKNPNIVVKPPFIRINMGSLYESK